MLFAATVIPAATSLGMDRTLLLTATGYDQFDAIDAAPLSYQWAVVSGPGAVSFTAPTSASTGASFGATGTYLLRVTLGDGRTTASAQATITAGQVVLNLAGWLSFQPLYDRIVTEQPDLLD